MDTSFNRQLLRVNLSTAAIQTETVPEEEVQTLLGGRALGAMILYRETTPGIDPLDPDNKLIFITGPLTGTSAFGSSRYCVLTKSPLTGLYLMSVSGGYLGPELNKAGYDAVVIEGKAERPVYITISDDSVDIKDASRIWGMLTDDVQHFIKDELEDEKVRISCIGPAGENLVYFSSIISGDRAAARGGSGAVMGSKNLKAIVVRGTKRQLGLADPEEFRRWVRRSAEEIAKNKVTAEVLSNIGTVADGGPFNMAGTIPWRNWQQAASEKADYIFSEKNIEKFGVKATRCAPPCPVKCTKVHLITEGSYSGSLSAPDYESAYALGSCCDITDFGAVVDADALCDKYGLDTVSTGVSLAFAMECYEKGIINNKDTEGKEIRFADASLLRKLIPDIAYRRGFGAILSLGTKRMAERFGKGSEDFAMHAKGLELGGYDPRGAKSYALIYACGPRGGCHHAGGYTIFPELASGEGRFSNKGKAALVKKTRERRVLCDSAIICTFVAIGVSEDTIAGLLSTSTGLTIDTDALYTIGDRGSNIERAFNVREGLRRSWDILPARLLRESPPSGPTKDQTVDLEPLLDDFYSVCGWDIKTGIPTRQKLSSLGLGKIADDLDRFQHAGRPGSG